MLIEDKTKLMLKLKQIGFHKMKQKSFFFHEKTSEK